MDRDNDKSVTPEPNDDKYVDERTRDKIRDHLSDPNSRITEQDIANVNTEMFRRTDEEMSDEALMPDKKTDPEDKIAPKPPNTWDILEE